MAGLIGLALTSCEEDNSLGIMQKNEAPVVVPADGVAIQSRYASTGNTIDLHKYQESNTIPLIDIELSDKFSTSSVVTGEVQIAANPDFQDAQTVKLTATEATSPNADAAAAIEGPTDSYVGNVATNTWEDAFVNLYGLDPNPRVNYLRYRLWINDGNQNIILYDENGEEWWDTMEFTVTPINMNYDIAPAYVLTYKISGVTHTMDMYHNPDKHEYDDPVFSATIEVPEEAANDVFWTVAPANDAARVFGVTAGQATVAEGNLVEISNGGTPGQLVNPGPYKIEVNMLEQTYSVKVAPKTLYVVYVGSGFNATNISQLGTTDYAEYSGMAGICNKWGLTGQASFRPTFYTNNTDVERTSNDNINPTYTGGLKFETSGQPINPDNGIDYPGTGQGLYYLTANLTALTYTGYQCKTIGVTGTLNDLDWGAKPDIEFKSSYSSRFMVWTGTVTVKAGDQWKIRANNDWHVNFGGVTGDYATDGSNVELVMGGENFVATEDATYNVTLTFRRGLDNDGNLTPYYMTVTKK